MKQSHADMKRELATDVVRVLCAAGGTYQVDSRMGDILIGVLSKLASGHLRNMVTVATPIRTSDMKWELYEIHEEGKRCVLLSQHETNEEAHETGRRYLRALQGSAVIDGYVPWLQVQDASQRNAGEDVVI